MQQDDAFDQPWWSIKVLLKWIGKGEEEGLAEIRKNESRLGLTGKRGPWYGTQNPRSSIPDFEFLDCHLEKTNGGYFYLCNRDFRGTPTAIWQDLQLRSADAKAVWPHSQATMSETHSGMPERPTAGKPGRKSGSGAIDDEDALRDMLNILARGEAPSVYAATGKVAGADDVKGNSQESTRRRLHRKFKERHGLEPPSGKRWSDIVD